MKRALIAAVAALALMIAPSAWATPPTVAVVEPDPNDVVIGVTTVDAAVTGSAVRVDYFVDGSFVAYDSSCCNWDEEWDSRTVQDGTHTITATARNSAGEVGTSAAVQFTVDNQPDPPAGMSMYGIFANGSADRAALRSTGFNTVTTSTSLTELNATHAAGLKAIVWLGGFNNEDDSPACTYTTTDAWVLEQVAKVKDHPAVAGYQIENEPHATECSNAYAQVRHRHDLVRSLDANPAHPTILAVYRDYEFDDYMGAADVLRVGMYPCSHASGCRFTRITEKVAAARSAGWTRLVGSPQAFGDEYYRIPTPSELQQILDTWRAAGVTDMLSYRWDTSTDPDTLVSHPELWTVFQANSPG